MPIAKTIAAAALVATLAIASPALAKPAAARDAAAEEANRKLVVEFYDRFFNEHEVEAASKVVSDDYKQHNPDVPDGKAPFVSYFTGFFKDNAGSKARVVRSAADGDLVWLHVHSTNGPNDRGQSVVDIFRVEKGRIVEHWDVIQNVPEKAENKNTMF